MNPLSSSQGPLTDQEFLELNQFLQYELDIDKGMTLDMADGMMHAIAVGPTLITPNQWLPLIWGEGSPLPPAPSIEKANYYLGLVLRHYNSIVHGLMDQLPEVSPSWSTQLYRGKEYETAEGWAMGFMDGVNITRKDWHPLFVSEKGEALMRPILLLSGTCGDQDLKEISTPSKRHKWTVRINDALLQIFQFWLPYREAIHERAISQHQSTKYGRNELCPCGSGKKFKKCCGSPAHLH